MKEVIAIYIDGVFKQYLKKSEVRLLLDVMNDHKGVVGIELTKIPEHRYKLEFN
jgi:hypothetical protein